MSQDTPNRTRRIIISLSVTVALLGGLAGGGALLWGQYGDAISRALGWAELDYPGPGEGEVVITISSGQIGSDVAATLAEHDVVKTAEGFTTYLIEQAPDAEFHPGTYALRAKMSPAGALEALSDPTNRRELTAMIPEGKTGEQTLEILAAATNLPLADFEAAAAKPQAYGVPAGVETLEGWLFPATYIFEPGTTAEQAVQRLVSEMIGVLDRLGVAEADRERVLTTASIVQREARHEEDMGKVARVIENRLQQDMLLQMDSTTQYGSDDSTGTVWSSDEALAEDNPWNTYKHKGLPIGPIANPGEAAIQAAIAPPAGEWLYFAAVNMETGETLFTTNVDDHNEVVKQLLAWCEANPGKGC